MNLFSLTLFLRAYPLNHKIVFPAEKVNVFVGKTAKGLAGAVNAVLSAALFGLSSPHLKEKHPSGCFLVLSDIPQGRALLVRGRSLTAPTRHRHPIFVGGGVYDAPKIIPQTAFGSQPPLGKGAFGTVPLVKPPLPKGRGTTATHTKPPLPKGRGTTARWWRDCRPPVPLGGYALHGPPLFAPCPGT